MLLLLLLFYLLIVVSALVSALAVVRMVSALALPPKMLTKMLMGLSR